MPFQFFKLRSALSQNKGFVIFALILFGFIYILENINQRFWLNDFRVYYEAAHALWNGGQVYGKAFGLETGYYKYSPFIAMVFVPVSWLPYHLASTIHFVLIALVAVFTLILLVNMMNKYVFQAEIQKRNLVMTVALLAVIRHLFRELHLGNINMILVFLVTMCLILMLRSRYWYAGICMGLAIVIKPYFLLMMLPLLLRKQFKIIIYTGLTLMISVLIPILLLGPAKAISLHREWFSAMLAHGTYLESSETIQSIIKYYIYEGLPDYSQLVIIGLVVGAYMIYSCITSKKQLQIINNESIISVYFITGYFVLLAVIPNLLITDTEHFLFTLPLIVLLTMHLSFAGNYLQISMLSMLILLPSLNTSDILGHELANKFDKMGILGLCNIGMIAMAVYLVLANKFKTGS